MDQGGDQVLEIAALGRCPETERAFQALEDAPKLTQTGAFYLQCFNELGSNRPAGMSLGAIPSEVVVRYGERLELDVLELEVFEHVIREVDRCFMASQAKKVAKQNN